MGWNDTAVRRRDVLKGGGCLVVSLVVPQARQASAVEDRPLWRALSPGQLDTYLKIDESGQVTAFFGKMDMGQGVDVSIAQIVADELELPFDRVDVVMGDTALTVNQGGASGSTGIERGANPLRSAAAEAQRVLLELGAERLGVDTEQVDVADGAVYLRTDPARRAGYGELIGGEHFDVRLEWNGRYGNALDARGSATPKDPSEYRVVGQSFPRRDLPEIVMG
ncbi:MAG: molybdopterin-dependent oxidoreductase, partial [Rhodospirillaceae bacterium]|nr:molybdopterin-dependent oxidoreductase [Rhodospirillaceae bacterium]